MSHEQVLVAVDIHDPNEQLIDIGSELALLKKAEIVFCYVSIPEPIPQDEYTQRDLDKLSSVQSAALCEIKPTHDSVKFSHVLLHGEPGEEIVNYVRNNDVLTVAIGTHGRKGVKRMILGSVAEHVLRRVDCPVTTVKWNKNFKQKCTKCECCEKDENENEVDSSPSQTNPKSNPVSNTERFGLHQT